MDYRLDTIALVVSQHYKLLKSIVTSGTELRPPTHEEAKVADYLADVLQNVAGKRIADYCREKFQNGWTSRDLRSYKIKFVLTRLRDTLSKTNPAREELLERINDLIDNAEYLAGCVTDNKRRNRKALEEQARKKAEKSSTSDSSQQMDLFEYAATQSSEPAEENEDIESMKDPGDIDFDFKISGASTDEPESAPAETTPEEPIAKKGKRVRKPKKSARERKFERMTEEILTSEYGNGDDDRDDGDEDNDNDNDNETEPEYEYGKHFSDTATTYGCDDGDNW